MPYFISNDNPECSGWAVEKDDGEIIGCHRTRREAIDQMVAVSLAEDIEPGGERSAKAIPEDRTPPQAAREEAQRGLDWRREYNRGGTEVGVARARDIANGRNLSIDTIKRMRSYFARHEVDQQGQGWNRDEEGYPSAGRIAWALWGGTPGRTWAESILEQIENDKTAGGETTMPEKATSGRTRPAAAMKQKSAAATFAVKSDTTEAPAGEVTALVSVFGNEDLVGDRVIKGAFAKSLAEIKAAGKSTPFVWSHQWSDPNAYIGKIIDAEETDEGLKVRAALFDTPTAQHIKTLLREGVVTEFSFAYDVIDQREGKDGVNELTELRLLEAGPTLKGANPATQLIGVRSALAAQKAEAGELEEGSWVTFGDDGYGRVEYIMTEGTFGVEGDPLSLEATPEDPLAMIRIYEEQNDQYVPTDSFQGFRFSELTASEEKAATAGKADRARTRQKVGRAISTKNEQRLRDARQLIGEVLETIGENTAEPAKTEEPDEVKVEEPGMDGEIALALLEIAEIE